MTPEDTEQWFVMRDLTRTNAKLPAYKLLGNLQIKTFTPLVQKVFACNGKKVCRQVPFIHDMVFVYSNRTILDPIVAKVKTFQYRFQKGRVPMTVRNRDMDSFIAAVNTTEFPHYYSLDEITPEMRKRHIRIVGGPLDGIEGCLLTTRGSKVRRLLVEVPTLLAAAVEVEPEYIQLL